jgi:hypothetical protein
MQTLREWFMDGLIDKQGYMRMLDATDLQSFTDSETSADVLVLESIEAMLHADDPEDDEAYLPPSQFVNPDRAILLTTQKIRWAKLRKAPDANIALLERMVVDYEALAAKARAFQQPPTPQAPPGVPAAGPPTGSAPMVPPGAAIPPDPNGVMPPMQPPLMPTA